MKVPCIANNILQPDKVTMRCMERNVDITNLDLMKSLYNEHTPKAQKVLYNLIRQRNLNM